MLIISLAMNFGVSWFSEHIAPSMTKSHPITEHGTLKLDDIVREPRHLPMIKAPEIHIEPPKAAQPQERGGVSAPPILPPQSPCVG